MEKKKLSLSEMTNPFFQRTNIITYFEGLHDYLEDVIVFLAVKDTPCGPYFTEQYGSIVRGGQTHERIFIIAIDYPTSQSLITVFVYLRNLEKIGRNRLI